MDGEWKWVKEFLQCLVFLDAECLCAIFSWVHMVCHLHLDFFGSVRDTLTVSVVYSVILCCVD